MSGSRRCEFPSVVKALVLTDHRMIPIRRDEATLHADVAAIEAASQLALDTGQQDRRVFYSQVARRLKVAADRYAGDAAILFDAGPHKHGRSLVEMLLMDSSGDQVRIAKILLSAITWDGR